MLRFFRKKSGSPSASDVASRAFILKSQIVTAFAIPPPEMFEQMSTWLSSADREQFFEQHKQRQSGIVEKLKAKGLTSPYLRGFVVARVNYTRFSKATSFDFDETIDKIIASAQKFNADRVSQQDVAKAGGGGPADED